MSRGVYFRLNAKVTRNCLICKKDFKTWLCEIKKGWGRFCSTECHNEWMSKNLKGENCPTWKGGLLTLNCLQCSNKFTVHLSVTKNGKGKFCSRKCCDKWRSINLIGKKSINWKGGITPINVLIRTSAKYLQWAKTIKERDDYTCQICNIRGGNLRANHIKKFSNYHELRFNLNNGITIHKDCDIKFILRHEELCEDFFNFNLIERGILQ